MATSADPEVRASWPAGWLPPGEVAGRDAMYEGMSKEECANDANWWWGPGRDAHEEARVWFRRRDGKWEELFIVKPSPALRAAGVSRATGLFAARRFHSRRYL